MNKQAAFKLASGASTSTTTGMLPDPRGAGDSRDMAAKPMHLRWVRHPHAETPAILDFIDRAFGLVAGDMFRNCSLWEAPEEQAHSLLLESEGLPAAHLSLWPKTILVDGGECRIGDIGAVVVAGNFRGQGLMRRLFDACVPYAREWGMRALVLGGNPDLYCKVGFSCNAATVVYEWPVSALRNAVDTVPAVRSGPPVPPVWEELYGLRRDGARRLRSTAYWLRLHGFFATAESPWLCFHTLQPAGVLIAVDKGEAIHVKEVLAADPAHVFGLLAAAVAYFPKADKLFVGACAGSPLDRHLQARMQQHGTGTRILAQGTMWRSLDPGIRVDSEWHLSMLDRR